MSVAGIGSACLLEEPRRDLVHEPSAVGGAAPIQDRVYLGYPSRETTVQLFYWTFCRPGEARFI